MAPSVFVVTNTLDAPASDIPGSLRAAIDAANNSTGPNSIAFNINSGPGGGLGPNASFTIALAAPLDIYNQLSVDGTTQPGYSGVPLVHLDGSAARFAGPGLAITSFALGTLVRGLEISGCGGGISVGASNCVIEGNYFHDNDYGIGVDGHKNVIGGNGLAAGNVIYSNREDGIIVSGDHNVIEQNLIGTDAHFSSGLGNVQGIAILDGQDNIIGGSVSADRNVIVASTGSDAFPFISPGAGIYIDSVSNGNIIQGNQIGSEDPLFGNSGPGVKIDGSNNVIGGPGNGAGNIIANNGNSGWFGVFIDVLTNPNAQGNTIRGNEMHDNGVPYAPGISFGGVYGEGGGSRTPKLSEAQQVNNATRIIGSFNSSAGAQFILDFYDTPPLLDPFGVPEGTTYLGSTSVQTDGAGIASFDVMLPATNEDDLITATATDAQGTTSGFSDPATVIPGQQPGISPTKLEWNTDKGGVDLSYQVTGAPLPSDTPIQFYWATSSDPSSQFEQVNSATVTVPANTQPDQAYRVHLNGDIFADEPPAARDLVAIADPDNTLGTFDPQKNVLVTPWRVLPVTPLYQKVDSSGNVQTWASDLLGSSPTHTLGDYGCSVTALAMALTYVGAPFDPGTLNSLLTAVRNGYNAGNDLLWDPAVQDASAVSFQSSSYLAWKPLSDITDVAAANDTLQHVVGDLEIPVIVGVDLGYRGTDNAGNVIYGPGHFVLVTGVVGDQFTIIDPGHPGNTSLDHYGNEFALRGYVADPTSRSNVLISAVSASPGVRLAVIDSHGNVTGVAPTTGQRVEQIPNSVHFIDALENDTTGEAPKSVSQQVDVVNPSGGVYTIHVEGMTNQAEPYSLLVSGSTDDGVRQKPIVIEGTASGSSLDQVKIEVDPGKGGHIQLLRPSLQSIPDQTVDEGSLLAVPVAATDADANAVLAYSLDVAPTGAAIDSGTGLFTWTPKDGPATVQITVRVTDNGSPALSDTKTFAITVKDAPLTLSSQTISPVEGQGLINVLVGTFTDPGTDGTTADYGANITWGDGEVSSSAAGKVTIIADPNKSGVFDIVASNKPDPYAEEAGSLNFIVVVDEHGGPSDSKTTTISVTDAPLQVTGQNITGREGLSAGIVTVATFTDSGGPEDPAKGYSATVDWGDGQSSSGAVVLNKDGQTFSVQSSHSYADESTYSVRVHIAHENGISADVSSAATVVDSIPLITGVTVSQGHNPHDVSLIFGYSDTGTEGHNLLVNWGDGAYDTINLGISAAGASTQGHRYDGGDDSTKHQATIVVTVLDDENTPSTPVVQTVKFGNGHGDDDGKRDNLNASAFLINGVSDGVQGQTLTYELRFNPTSPLTSQAGTTFSVTWGDGTSQLVAPVSGVLSQHVYKTNGAYAVQLIATDSLSHVTLLASNAVAITAVALESDPLDPDLTVLAVGGSLAGDTITIDRVTSVDHDDHDRHEDQNALAVTINGVTQIYSAPRLHDFGRIQVFAQSGANHILVSGQVTLAAELHGGSGSDTLIGGGGNNILVGGTGNELLIGGQGRNLLIGGFGKSILQGGPHDDILVGGATAYDNNDRALAAILAEWNSDDSYLRRIAEITGKKSSDDDVYFLNSNTVYDATAQDVLTGNGGRDWFFAGKGDKITDLQTNEVVS